MANLENIALTFGLSFLVLIGTIQCFNTGAPDNSCKDPSVFHTRRVNATHEGVIMPQDMSTNPYVLDVDMTSFKPGDKVTVTLRGLDLNETFKGFFIQAVHAGVSLRDVRRQAFGRFKNISSNERPSACQSIRNIARGGITHTSSKPKKSISAVWLSPKDYNPGNIQFLATGVQNYDTYWIDVRSQVVTADGYKTAADNTGLTPTGAWFHWLQEQLHQYNPYNMNQAGPTGAGVVPKTTGAGSTKAEMGSTNAGAELRNNSKTV